MSKLPDKIYLSEHPNSPKLTYSENNFFDRNVEYIKSDVVEAMLKKQQRLLGLIFSTIHIQWIFIKLKKLCAEYLPIKALKLTPANL